MMDAIAWNNAMASFIDEWKPANVAFCVTLAIVASRFGWLLADRIFGEGQ